MKKYVVAFLVLAFSIWPIAHAAMVYVYDMNPWKFCGFAMYCVPPPRLSVRLFDVNHGRRVPLASPEVDDEGLAARRAFLRRRLHTGTLLEPDFLAGQVFAAYPQVHLLEIVLEHRLYDLEQRRVVDRKYGFRFARQVP